MRQNSSTRGAQISSYFLLKVKEKFNLHLRRVYFGRGNLTRQLACKWCQGVEDSVFLCGFRGGTSLWDTPWGKECRVQACIPQRPVDWDGNSLWEVSIQESGTTKSLTSTSQSTRIPLMEWVTSFCVLSIKSGTGLRLSCARREVTHKHKDSSNFEMLRLYQS